MKFDPLSISTLEDDSVSIKSDSEESETEQEMKEMNSNFCFEVQGGFDFSVTELPWNMNAAKAAIQHKVNACITVGLGSYNSGAKN